MKKPLALSLLCLAMSAQAHVTIFTGTFAPEATGATGTGTLQLDYDADGHTLLINATWSGLSGTTTNAHIHCCTTPLPRAGTAGVALGQQPENRLPGFPLGVTGTTYLRVIDLTQTNQYSATFLAGSGGTPLLAEQRLIANLTSGNAYFNIHSSTFGTGEIRAFVTAVPEPETYAMMFGGLALMGAMLRRRRQS